MTVLLYSTLLALLSPLDPTTQMLGIIAILVGTAKGLITSLTPSQKPSMTTVPTHFVLYCRSIRHEARRLFLAALWVGALLGLWLLLGCQPASPAELLYVPPPGSSPGGDGKQHHQTVRTQPASRSLQLPTVRVMQKLMVIHSSSNPPWRMSVFQEELPVPPVIPPLPIEFCPRLQPLGEPTQIPAQRLYGRNRKEAVVLHCYTSAIEIISAREITSLPLKDLKVVHQPLQKRGLLLVIAAARKPSITLSFANVEQLFAIQQRLHVAQPIFNHKENK